LMNIDLTRGDEHIQPYPLDNGTSKFDLSIQFTETSTGLAASIEYNTALYKPQTITRMAVHFAALCEALTRQPAVPVRDLDYVGEAERQRLLVEFNDMRAAYPKERCLHHLFIEAAAREPEKTAVVCGDASLTYGQLQERSSDLALYLQSQGVGPDSLVCVCMERTPDMLVGLLGILQAGGAYVPLDPAYPDERLAYMARDSGAAIVLTQGSLQQRLGALTPGGMQLVALDGQWPEIAGHAGALGCARRQVPQLLPRRTARPRLAPGLGA